MVFDSSAVTAAVYKMWKNQYVQFAAVMIAIQFPTPQFAAKQSSNIKKAVVFVGVLQLLQFAQSVKYYLRNSAKSLWAIETTSQVNATRANVMEWRSCLEFISKWHSTSLQASYKLWQKKTVSVPACPANQWMQLATGQPMCVMDECKAQSDWSISKDQLMQIDYALTSAHEKFLMMDDPVTAAQFDDATQQSVQFYEAVYQEFAEFASATNNFDSQMHGGTVAEGIVQFMGRIDWSAKAFQ